MKTLLHSVIVYPDESQCIQGGLLFENGKIIQLLSQAECEPYLNKPDMEIIDGQHHIVMPGLIDLHLHGSYGYDFIRDPEVSIHEVARRLPEEGTTAFLSSLTVISHQECVELLKQYRHVNTNKEEACWLGVHMEGPYLSHEFKALMDERYLRDYDAKEMEEMLEAAQGKLKSMTFAPERKGSDTLLKQALAHHMVMMIGHSGCTSLEANTAIKLGAHGFTHLYNAMSQHSHRNPGAVTSALMKQGFSELIVDGFHVHPDVVRATYQSLGPQFLILITDAMLGKGMPNGEYVFSGLHVRKKGIEVQVIDTGRIAGSAITMIDAIKNMHAFCGCSLNELVHMACVNPAVLVGIENQKGRLNPGLDADMILIDDQFNLQATFIQGKQVYQSKQ